VKAVKKFKSLLWKRRPELMSGILGQGVRYVQPPLQLDEPGILQKSKSLDLEDQRPVDIAAASEGIHRQIKPDDTDTSKPLLHRIDSAVVSADAVMQPKEQPVHRHNFQHSFDGTTPLPHLDTRRTHSVGDKGHAHDPMETEPPLLGIGPGLEADAPPETPVCAESPTAADFNIYDAAYQLEVERIRKARGKGATVYLTRRVDSKNIDRADENMVEAPKASEIAGQPHTGWKSVLDAAREKEKNLKKPLDKGLHSHTVTDIATHAGNSAKAAAEGQQPEASN
jgi:calcium/calmodulin-dependent protein kinase kinase 2